MVVIVILGILASLVVPNLMGNKDQADHQKPSVTSWRWKMPSTCTNWITARYPTTDQGLNALVIKPDSEPAPRNYKEGGLHQTSAHLIRGRANINCSVPVNMATIDVFDGPDGQAGTDDDIGNWNLGQARQSTVMRKNHAWFHAD